ncbi:MAG: hypothetical protein OEU26_32940, partial [Candidatus Tectomicrobia bacterium]|nr:hypothetical protein [Candidatus Tectomicrobia bacterium]
QNADLGQHTTQLLDELYALNTGAIEDGRLPAPPVMPDCAEQIQAQTRALQAITSDDAQTRRTKTAAVLHHTLSLFAQGPHAEPIEAFLETFNERIKWVNTLPTPMSDCAESIQLQIDTLSNLDGIDNAPQLLEALVNVLCHTLSVFAQGPNELPVQTLLGRVQQTTSRANTLTPPVPDYSTHLQSAIDLLEELVYPNDPESIGDAETTVLCRALSAFAQGPNEEPIQTLLAAVERLKKQKDIGLGPVLPDETHSLQPHIEALTALEGLDDPEALTAAAAVTLYEALAEMAQGSHETPIRALLDTFDKVTGAD